MFRAEGEENGVRCNFTTKQYKDNNRTASTT